MEKENKLTIKYKLSLIVACYNVETYIGECIDSLLNNRPNNVEIVLVNDGSTDNTLDLISKYEKLENIVIINQTNQGLSAVRNNGLNGASGEYVCFIDGDDYIDKEFYHNMIPIINGNHDIIVSNYYHDYNGDIRNIDVLENINDLKNKNELFAKTYYKATVPRYIVKKDLLIENDVDFPVGLIHEDHYWGLKLANVILTKKVDVFYNDSYYWYYYRKDREGSIMTTKKNWKNLYSLIKINIMLEEDDIDKDLLNEARITIYSQIEGYFNPNNPKEKNEEIIKLIDEHKSVFKCYKSKYLIFYILLKIFGFKITAKIIKPLYANK